MKLKPFLFLYLSVILALLIINACTLNKRVYRSGYNVEWANFLKNPSKRELTRTHYNQTTEALEIRNPLEGNNLTADASPKDLILHEVNSPQKNHFSSKTKTEGCDTIVFKNGLKIKAKILEISATEVKYKMCDNPDGPTFIKGLTEVVMIRHANGTVTETGNTVTTVTINGQTTSQSSTKTTSNTVSDKSQLTALLLCIFLGFLGVHRFYLGQIGIGLLMLFTGGCCGILWLIDLVRIIIGNLQPEDGDYGEKL